jgi:superfamily I DNA/RNA helicase
MVQALEPAVYMIAAADEFQCLIPELKPNPSVAWLNERCKPVELLTQHRTSRLELISAATAVRNGHSLPILSLVKEKEAFANLKKFSLTIAAGTSPFIFASTCVSNAILWNGGTSIAIITPARGDFAVKVVEQVSTKVLGKKKSSGPFPIEWERSDETVIAEAFRALALPSDGDIERTFGSLSAQKGHAAFDLCRSSLLHHQSLTGCTNFPHSLVREHLSSAFLRHRRFGSQHGPRVRAMTVHSAKNREFEGVIILWPFSATGSADYQRRLLYNAITRAQRWCTIIVQSRDMLKKAPFASDK